MAQRLTFPVRRSGLLRLTDLNKQLVLLLLKVGVALSELVEAAWPSGAIVHENTLDVYLARLRRKLRDVPDSPRITTIQRVGYRLTWPESR